VLAVTCGASTPVTVTVMPEYAEPSAVLAEATWVLRVAAFKLFADVCAFADFAEETSATKVTRALRRAAEEVTEQPVAHAHAPLVCS